MEDRRPGAWKLKRKLVDWFCKQTKSSGPCKISAWTQASPYRASCSGERSTGERRSVQLPELGPGPAGPGTRWDDRTKNEVPGQHSTMRCFFFFLFSQNLFYINLPSVDTGVSSMTSFWKLWFSLIDVHCAATSRRRAGWVAGTRRHARAGAWPPPTKTSYLYPLVPTP